jgi:integrase/recombinase XerD
VKHLFLNQYGQPLSPDGLSWRVRDYFKRAGITKRGACHLFRHTMATAMLDNGADIRHVQEILGHGQITSTQRYTHVSIARLHAVHAATHPAARLLREGQEP